MINCSIGTQHFSNTLCDLGASISVIPKVVFDKLNFTHLTPTRSTMDYEVEGQYEEMEAEPQAEVIEIDVEDAPR